MTSLSDEFNNWKKRYEEERTLNLKLLNAMLKAYPKSNLIDFLIKKKIIKRDYVSNEITLLKELNKVDGFPKLDNLEHINIHQDVQGK